MNAIFRQPDCPWHFTTYVVPDCVRGLDDGAGYIIEHIRVRSGDCAIIYTALPGYLLTACAVKREDTM